MKKTLILALMIVLSAGCSFAMTDSADKTKATTEPLQVKTLPQADKMMHKSPHHRGKADFEKRLNLTEEQKAQAKILHEKGFNEMKPIMEQIKDLKQKKEAVKLSRIAIEEQEKRIAELDIQIKSLKKQARELRNKNFKEFEAILTDKQKKELKKMKKEGRKNFEKKKKDFDKMKKNCQDKVKCEFPITPPPAPSVEKK